MHLLCNSFWRCSLSLGIHSKEAGTDKITRKHWCNGDADDDITCYSKVNLEKHVCSWEMSTRCSCESKRRWSCQRQWWGSRTVGSCEPSPTAMATGTTCWACPAAEAPLLAQSSSLCQLLPHRSATTTKCWFWGHHYPNLPCAEGEEGATFYTALPPLYPTGPPFPQDSYMAKDRWGSTSSCR